jgi:hypothetical protein
MAFAGTDTGSSMGGGIVAGVEVVLIADISESGLEGRVIPLAGCMSTDTD